MKKITLLFLSQVGFEILKSQNSKKVLIDKVIVGKDNSINDYFKNIKLFFKNIKITCENKKSHLPIKNFKSKFE